MQKGDLGYICPTWLAPSQRPTAASAGSRLDLDPASCTAIVLPWKGGVGAAGPGGGSGSGGGQGAALRRRLEDLHPSLLLFLQRLQCIVVTDREQGSRCGGGEAGVPALNPSACCPGMTWAPAGMAPTCLPDHLNCTPHPPPRSNVMVKRELGGGLVELRHGPQVSRYPTVALVPLSHPAHQRVLIPGLKGVPASVATVHLQPPSRNPLSPAAPSLPQHPAGAACGALAGGHL